MYSEVLTTQYMHTKCNTYIHCYIFLAFELRNLWLLSSVGKME